MRTRPPLLRPRQVAGFSQSDALVDGDAGTPRLAISDDGKRRYPPGDIELNLARDNQMLTFELTSDRERVEIHGDREGLLLLAQHLTELAAASSPDHVHLMTPDWGGAGLTDMRQGLSNELIHHAKIFFWPKQ